jgi:hypothetical protein
LANAPDDIIPDAIRIASNFLDNPPPPLIRFFILIAPDASYVY